VALQILMLLESHLSVLEFNFIDISLMCYSDVQLNRNTLFNEINLAKCVCNMFIIYYFQVQIALLVRIHVSCKFMEDLQWYQQSLQH
jgi:hypothetical protein